MNTSTYQHTHGKKPQTTQRGWWAFRGPKNDGVYFAWGTLREAAREAAKAMGCKIKELTVQP